ncbi:DNA topoisomerase IB [Tropicibacter naphthalenivorans]|uniref:DNA topoisomerase n=1 Tax=Tropicibacter naphthalenivorans TaxID=441103 RepID=A0A0P1GS44_9RHOB|nr:DNA topoisomerase IB [Tropicibacter naphthalenivorans]CUH78040.1 DNA topoisomerase type I [Tropicibacter naphthalenivorans]SMC94051.1 DNA topoisomerase-1 [Tropicibacter naphthalenivorans]
MLKPPDLIYFPDDRPGITRQRRGRGFSYLAPDGTRIDDPQERSRIKALAVPPAYQDVWICPADNGHLQATGRDARGRKQYRYHPDWRAWRNAQKFDHLRAFGEALPALRRRIRQTLREGTAGDRDFALAAILALLDRASLRVGSTGYARENQTFGATTLRRRHLALDDDRLTLRYQGKGGKTVRKTLRDQTLNRTLTRLGDLAGPQLVTWLDDGGTPHGISAGQVNAALAEITGQPDLTAKTFRTWNGSAAALQVALEPKPTIKAMADAAAARLHNTPAIARKSYIHPSVINLCETPRDLSKAPTVHGLRQTEARLLHLLSD